MVRKNNRPRRLTKADRKEFEYLVKANMKRAYFTALGLTGSHDMAMVVYRGKRFQGYIKNSYIITGRPDMTTR